MAEKVKLPYGATHFVETDKELMQFKAVGEQKEPRLKMTAYSGRMIENHWYWGNLVIRTDGIKFGKRTPILEEHFRDKKIGFCDSFTVEAGALKTVPDSTVILDTPEALQFVKNAEKGFPYQSSIFAIPQKVTRYEKPASVEVNGFKFANVDTVWEESELQEASVCTFGYDTRTSSSAFSDNQDENEIEVDSPLADSFKQRPSSDGKTPHAKEVKSMEKITLEQFKAEYKEVADQFAAEIISAEKEKAKPIEEQVAQFSKDLKELGGQLTSLTTANEALKAENAGLKDQITKFSKDADKVVADKIWETKLSASLIPEELHGKVTRQVQADQFYKDGAFDKDAFTTAVEKEITEWEDAGAKKQSAMGFGSVGSAPAHDDDEHKMTDENKNAIDTMASFLDKSTLKKSD